MVKRKHIGKALAAVLALTVIAGSMPAMNTAAVGGSELTVLTAEAPALQNNSTVNYKTVGVNKSIKVTAAAKGGTGGYTYAYYYKKQSVSKWSMKKNFSTTSSISMSFSITGTYDICVKVKDSAGTIEKKYFTVKVNPALTCKAKISSKSITLGQTVTLQGAASGGSGGYKYSYLYRIGDKGSWKTLKGFSTSTSVKFTPSAEGNYTICIKAKDSYSTIDKMYFDLAVSELKNDSRMSADTVKEGTKVTLTGVASGGNGNYSYAYLIQSPGSSNWQTLKDFSTTRSCSFKPSKVGTYNVCIKVKDVTGTIAKKYMELRVTEKPASEKITDSIITSDMTNIQKVKAIHDWLVSNVEYDEEGYSAGSISDESHTAAGLFKNRKAVCDGYANAFKEMAEYAGFETVVITGVGIDSNNNVESHAWNQVKIDGKWYNIDVTWDDPVTSGSFGFDNIRYTYFLIPDSIMDIDHIADADSVKYPCNTPQPTDIFVEDVIEDDIENHENYAMCKTDDDVKNVTNSFINQGISQFTIIYKISDFENDEVQGEDTVGYIQKTALYSQNKYNYVKTEYTDWKFEGYIQMTMTFTYAPKR